MNRGLHASMAWWKMQHQTLSKLVKLENEIKYCLPSQPYTPTIHILAEFVEFFVDHWLDWNATCNTSLDKRSGKNLICRNRRESPWYIITVNTKKFKLTNMVTKFINFIFPNNELFPLSLTRARWNETVPTLQVWACVYSTAAMSSA